jgi:DHA1 family bicyclomycin/chloramphenicol resistance-like MFS transporter
MNPLTLLWLITGCLMLQPLSTDLYLASLPHLADYFAATPAAVQQTLSLFVIGFGSAQLISGPLSDRFGRRPLVIGGLILYILATIACGLAPSLGFLMFARFVQAIGCCTAVVVARAIIRDAYAPAEGARVIARASTLMSFAPLLGPIAGGYLQVSFGWRAGFALVTLLSLALLAVALKRLEETLAVRNPRALQPADLIRNYRTILGSAAFWAYALPGALSYAAIFVFISGSSFVLIRVLGVPTELYGYCFAFGVSGYLFGTMTCRHLLGRRGLERMLGIGAYITLAGGALFFLLIGLGCIHWSVVLACQFITMFAHGINFPCAQAGAVAPFPNNAGAAAGLLGSLTMLAAWCAGTWVGLTHDGTLQPLATISASFAVMLLASAMLTRRHRRLA